MTKARIERVLEIVLAVITVYGIITLNPSIAINGGIGLVITFLPAYLQRDSSITLSPAITLWITAAVALHAIGALGFYSSVWWYDHVAHTLSASIVAGVGYAVTRAVDKYDEAIHLPSQFMALFIFVFVMAFGVTWELLEFLSGYLSNVLGMASVVTQYGLHDSVIDLVFDAVGGILFGILGVTHVQHAIDDLENYFADRIDVGMLEE